MFTVAQPLDRTFLNSNLTEHPKNGCQGAPKLWNFSLAGAGNNKLQVANQTCFLEKNYSAILRADFDFIARPELTFEQFHGQRIEQLLLHGAF